MINILHFSIHVLYMCLKSVQARTLPVYIFAFHTMIIIMIMCSLYNLHMS